ncbi:MAG TPA: CinA family protein [Caulobacter sp.]|nr:MAG: damage-inducible protein CinA [Caulobacter sp. 39-67-4]HQR89427.1 CinA family protein [Caulobacter sp.]
MFPLEIETLARLLVAEAREQSLRLVTAESCTGGLVAGAICSISGASDVFERGFVTYTNRAKSEMLKVPGDLIADHGAVSQPVARMMAEGALEASNGHVTVSIIGVAGPGAGTPMKPVGTVHFAVARANRSVVHRHEVFDGQTREAVQLAAVRTALEMLREAVASRG